MSATWQYQYDSERSQYTTFLQYIPREVDYCVTKLHNCTNADFGWDITGRNWKRARKEQLQAEYDSATQRWQDSAVSEGCAY